MKKNSNKDNSNKKTEKTFRDLLSDSHANSDFKFTKDPVKSVKSTKNDSEKPISKHIPTEEDHFFLPQKLISSDRIKSLKSKKNTIIMVFGIFTGILLVIFGLIIVSIPLEKVSDNVIFSEKAVFSVFLILVGILIISAILAHRLLSKTYLKKLHEELQLSEGKSPKSKKTDVKEKK